MTNTKETDRKTDQVCYRPMRQGQKVLGDGSRGGCEHEVCPTAVCRVLDHLHRAHPVQAWKCAHARIPREDCGGARAIRAQACRGAARDKAAE